MVEGRYRRQNNSYHSGYFGHQLQMPFMEEVSLTRRISLLLSSLTMKVFNSTPGRWPLGVMVRGWTRPLNVNVVLKYRILYFSEAPEVLSSCRTMPYSSAIIFLNSAAGT